MESDDEAEVPVHMMKSKDIVFERDEAGEFILPEMHTFKLVRGKQRAIRGYIGAVYRMCSQSIVFYFLIQMTGEYTGNSRATFPFALASKDDQNIYSTDCVPVGFKLSDPDHLNAADTTALYTHWIKRQRKGLPPFIVLNGSPNHEAMGKKKKSQKVNPGGKGKARYVEIDDETESDKESDDNVESEEEEKGSDEEMLPPMRFGPPNRKGKTFPLSTQDPSQLTGPSKLPPPTPFIPSSTQDSPMVASSSKLPPPTQPPKKKVSKKTTPKTNLKKKNLPMHAAQRIGKSGSITKSSRRQGGKDPVEKQAGVSKFIDLWQAKETYLFQDDQVKKRKREDEEEPTAEGSKQIKSTPMPQVRAREVGRVKNFPGGNAATSASRIAFLKSLCRLPRYLDLVNLVQAVVRAFFD